jgi:hypothetical protein
LNIKYNYNKLLVLILNLIILNLRSSSTPGIKAGSELKIRKDTYNNFCGISTYAIVPETIEEMNGLNIINLIETN